MLGHKTNRVSATFMQEKERRDKEKEAKENAIYLSIKDKDKQKNNLKRKELSEREKGIRERERTLAKQEKAFAEKAIEPQPKSIQDANNVSHYSRDWRLRNIDKIRKKEREARAKRRAWYDQLMTSITCSRCPESDPICIDWHHINPNEKVGTISSLFSKGKKREIIEAELAKCIPLCANCHRKEHSKLKEPPLLAYLDLAKT